MSVDRLSLPEVLARPRDHAVICTFGANLEFYEGPLWRYITRARNRVVLADDVTLARQLSDLAAGGSRLRHVNINYVVAPITNAGSAHAKLILLADGAGGTLLAGSGNVNIDGYASRGEVFCRYDVSSDDLAHLPEFQTAKEFLDLMAARGYLDSQARHHLDAMWTDTPWIWGPPSGRRSVLRHNLITPFADQLMGAVAGEPVLDLVAHAPFHDPACEALRRLLAALEPEHVTVLVQRGRTSVDPAALERALADGSGNGQVKLAAVPEFPETYLHAKFILVRTESRSITFTGSANLSLAALYATDLAASGRLAGNIELVNLLEGPPAAFDHLLAGLELAEITTAVSALDVRYLGDIDERDDAPGQPQLRRGSWADGELMLTAVAELPEGTINLVIAGTDAAAQITASGVTITARPAPEGAAVLDARAVPVWLRITGGDGDVETTPVYPYHPASLARLLTSRRDPELLRRSGSLDMEAHDEDLTALLDELDAAIVIDRQSLWRLARRSVPADGGDSDGPRRAWEDLDFDALRRHPKLAQYHTLDRRADRLEATDLQIVLAAITDHFRGIGQETGPANQPTAAHAEGMLDVDLDEMLTQLPGDRDDTPTDETPEEFESDDDEDHGERERRRLKIETRNRLAWQRFCDRFTKALQDPEFIDLVGPNVALVNAIIFNHLLALLVAKDIVSTDKGVDHQLRLWAFLWGDDDSDGYLATLDEEAQIAAMEQMGERGVELVILAAVDFASQLTRSAAMGELRSRLRHTWRRLLASPFLVFGKEALQRALRPNIRSAGHIASELDALAREWTEREVNEAIASCLGTTPLALDRRRPEVHRGGRPTAVDVIEVSDPGVSLDATVATEVFAVLAVVNPDRDYIRIHHPASKVIAVWDRTSRECWWYDRHTDEHVDLPEPGVEEPAWARESATLRKLAQMVDAKAA